MYAVKEIHYTLQGEGAQTGRPAVFCRFAGCNLWSGREQDRGSAMCQFCDTDFVGTNGRGGGNFASAGALAAAIAGKWAPSLWGKGTADPLRQAQGRLSTAPLAKSACGSAQDDRPFRKFVVCTGGEPLLQLDAPLVEALHACNFEIAVETNGTIEAPAGLDWICVSPKAGVELMQRTGDELKLVYPQAGAEPELFEALPFRYFSLQPMDGPSRNQNTTLALRYCLDHPRWRLSLQTHKLLGIP